MNILKKVLRLFLFTIFVVLAAGGLSFSGGIPLPPLRNKDRIEVIAEKQKEDEEELKGQKEFKF